MFGFIKSTKDFYHLGITFDLVYQALYSLIPKVQHASDKSEYNEEVFTLAYACSAGIQARLDKHNWTLNSNISVPSISKGNITIFVALSKTVSVLEQLALSMDLQEEVEDILNKGELFDVFDKICPQVFKNKIGL